MASSLGSLVVSLGLDAAEFVGGMTKSEYQAKQFSQRIGRDLQTAAKAAAVGLAALGAAGVAALSIINREAEKISAFKGLSEQIGDTASQVASLQLAADLSGTALDTVAQASVKLTSELAKTKDESKGAGAALAAINLPLKEFKSLNPVQQLEAVARALDGYADGAEKTAIATQLFGRSGAQLLPFLNDLAVAGNRQVRLTDEQIATADNFTKALARQKAELSVLAQIVVAESLPAVSAFQGALNDTVREIIGIGSEVDTLAGNKGVKDFADGAVRALGFVVDAVDGVSRAFEIVGRSLGAAAAAAVAVAEGEFKRARSIASEAAADVEAILQRTLFSTRLAQRLAQSGDDSTTRAPRPRIKLPEPDGAADKAKKAREPIDQAARYLESLQRQLQATENLSVAETVLSDIRAGRLGKVSERQQAELLGVAQQIDAVKRLESTLKAQAEQERDLADARRRLADEGKALFDATRTPLERLNAEFARLDSLLAQGAISWDTYARATLAAIEETDNATKKAAETIDTFAQRAAQNFQDFLGEGLFNALNGNFKGIEQSFIQMVNRLIAEAAAADLARYLLGDAVKGGSGKGFLGDIFGAIVGSFGFGGGKANGGPVGANSMYRVAENRPETLDVNGEKFLLMGNQRGNIDPNPRMGGGRSVVLNNTFTISGNVDRSTQAQIAARTGRAVQAALARNE